MNERLYGEGMALLNHVCVVIVELKHETAYATEHAPLSLAGCLSNGHGSECSLTHTSSSLLVQSPQPVEGVPLGTSLALSDNLRTRFPRIFHLILLPIPSPSLSVQEYSVLQERRRLGHVMVAYEADLFTHPSPQTNCIQAADFALFSFPVLLSPSCALYTVHASFSFSGLSQGCPCLRSSSEPPSSSGLAVHAHFKLSHSLNSASLRYSEVLSKGFGIRWT